MKNVLVSPPQRSSYSFDAKMTVDQVKRCKEKAIVSLITPWTCV